MAENQNTIIEQTPPDNASAAKTPFWQRFLAGAKEWGRKQIVALKRKPQNITLICLAITTVVYLVSLNSLSQGPTTFSDASWMGFCVFVNTLLSILILALFLNAFPKYPKVNKKTGKKTKINYVMLALVFVFMGIMIACDIIYRNIMLGQIAGSEAIFFKDLAQAQPYEAYWSEAFAANPTFNAESYQEFALGSMGISITHLVMIAVCAVLLATLPFYSKLIMKIDTSKQLEETQLNAKIETEDE